MPGAPFRLLKINFALTRNDSALCAIPYSGREYRLKLEMIQTPCGKTRYISIKTVVRKSVEKLYSLRAVSSKTNFTKQPHQ